MGSHISPGLVTEIRLALDLIQEHGTDDYTLEVVREIVSRRLAEITSELAERPYHSPTSLVALERALQKVAVELEFNWSSPRCQASSRSR